MRYLKKSLLFFLAVLVSLFIFVLQDNNKTQQSLGSTETAIDKMDGIDTIQKE